MARQYVNELVQGLENGTKKQEDSTVFREGMQLK